MDNDTKFALLVAGVPILGLLYCAFILAVMFSFPEARHHPIILATIFAIAPSLVSGLIWLKSSAKAKNKEQIGL